MVSSDLTCKCPLPFRGSLESIPEDGRREGERGGGGEGGRWRRDVARQREEAPSCRDDSRGEKRPLKMSTCDASFGCYAVVMATVFVYCILLRDLFFTKCYELHYPM